METSEEMEARHEKRARIRGQEEKKTSYDPKERGQKNTEKKEERKEEKKEVSKEKYPAKDFTRNAEQDRVLAQEKEREERKEVPKIERQRSRDGMGY